MRAIESPSTLDDQQWLTYWVLYSLITLFELSCWKVLQWYMIQPVTLALLFNVSRARKHHQISFLVDTQATILAIHETSVLHVVGATNVQWCGLHL